MVGCFGLIDDPGNPYHFPRDRLVEKRGRLDSFWLNRIGAFTGEGMVTELKWGKESYHLARHTPDILVNGNPVGVTWTDWGLAWFLCPRCSRRCRFLYLGELCCQTCGCLDWSSRHVSRSVPNLARLKWLRRRIGVSEQPFSPLPKRPRSHTRYNRIADEIRALERGLVAHLGSINQTLQRRIRVRKSKGKW